MLQLNADISKSDVDVLMQRLEWMGLEAILEQIDGRYRIALIKGLSNDADMNLFSSLPGVDAIFPITEKYMRAGRSFKSYNSELKIGNRVIGDGDLTLIAGSCSVESEEQIFQTAASVEGHAEILRGGAFKPRTSPYDFQGLGEQGLIFMAEAAKAHGLLTVSEVMDTQEVDLVAKYIDILQIGARNMQNYSLLKAVGRTGHPVLLKRGLAATYQEFLLAAEYIMDAGSERVILCERGIRTFETYTRNTLDLTAVPVLKQLSHLPVVVDPSHGTGLRSLVAPMAMAAAASGADGLMIEMHPRPDEALSDAQQTISPQSFIELASAAKQVHEVTASLKCNEQGIL